MCTGRRRRKGSEMFAVHLFCFFFFPLLASFFFLSKWSDFDIDTLPPLPPLLRQMGGYTSYLSSSAIYILLHTLHGRGIGCGETQSM